MTDVNLPRECNQLCVVGRLSGGRGGGAPNVGATLCTFPAFSLVPKNAIVDNPHRGPHILTHHRCLSRCISTLLQPHQRCEQHRTPLSLHHRSCDEGKLTVLLQIGPPQSPVSIISSLFI